MSAGQSNSELCELADLAIDCDGTPMLLGHGAAVSRSADEPVRFIGAGRSPSCRDQAARQADAPRGACLDMQRPTAAARDSVCLRADTAAAGPPTALVFRALTAWRRIS